MPKDFTAPSQNWNVQDQFNQSKQINQENNNTLDLYKKKTENIKFIQSSLAELENNGQDVSLLRKKLDEKLSNSGLGFGEKLGVVGRNLGNDYASSFSKAFGGNLDKSYSDKLDEAKQKREEIINPVSTIATEVALDPLTYTPLSFASKGTKAVRMAKDFGKGAGLSAGLYTAKEYGDDNYKASDSAIAGAFGGGLNALLGRVLNRNISGNLTNPDATSGENITNKILFEQNKLKADVVAAPTQPIGDEVVQENIIKPNNNQDDIAAKINQSNFGNTQQEVVRSDMPKVDNSIDSNQVNDFFNPVDKNRVQAQGNKNLPTPASQQDPFVYNPNKPVDTFGFEKDAQKNAELQALKQKIDPLNKVIEENQYKANINAEKKDYSPYILDNQAAKPMSKLPDVLPLGNREEMKSIIRFAKDNDAVDEFISKLPQNARVDEVQKFFDNLKPTEIKQDGIIPVTSNIKQPIKNYDISVLQEFEGLTKATGNNTADVLSLEKFTNTQGVRNAIDRYVAGNANQRDYEILDAVQNFMKYGGDNFRQRVGVTKPDASMKIDDAVRNNIDFETANKAGAIPFSNGTQTFGGGAVGGMESEFNQRDYNNDGKHDYKDNIYGAIVGVLGVNAARKIFPKAFKDGNIDRNTAGSFVGKNPTDTKDLMIQHNLSQDNLKFANQNRGLVAPSLATVKKDMPIDGFGDITLLGDKNLATPTKDMKAFASDIYSPRYPRERREYSQADVRKVDNSLTDYIHKTGGGDVSTSSDISDLSNNVALKAKFLEEEKGIALKIPNRVNPQEETLKQFYKSEYKASIANKGLDYQTLARDPNFQNKVLEELKVKYQDNPKALDIMTQPDRLQNLAKDRAMNLDQIGRSQNKPDFYKAREIADKQIAKYKAEFDEYVKNIQESYKYKSTFNNNGKDVPYNEQNIMKYLTSNLRGGENWNYGGGSVRALVTPEFKTLAQIKKAKDRLITSKEFEVIRESVNNELLELGAKVARNSMEGVGVVTEYMSKGKAALRGYDVDNLTIKQLEEFKTKLKEMPTEYFESKYLGKLELSNFKLAIIPKNASKETKEILAKNGIKYKTYDPKLPDSRIEVIKREAEKNNVLFASPTISGGLVGGVTGATSDLDGDGKITYKDIAIGAIGGAGLTKGVILAKNTNAIVNAKNLIKKASDTDFVDAIIGHKIYQKTDYMNLREKMLTAKNKALDDFAQLHEQLKLLDDNTRKDMYKYMSGENVTLNGNIKTLADNYKNEINRLSQELVDLKVLDQAQADKFKDRYLHRRYEKDLSQKFNSLFKKGKTVNGVYVRGNEWTGTKAEYDELVANGEIGDFFQGKIEATRMNNGQYKFRQDWTPEQRARWGEIEDIAFSLPETLMRSTEMVQHAKMLKDIVDNTRYVLDEATDGYVQLNGKKYGALQGKYVPKDMASDIDEFHNAIFGHEGGIFSKEVGDTFRALSTFWKKSHTVYNPIAHANNLVSNVTMQFGAGVNPNKAVQNAYKGALAAQKVKQFRELTAKELIGLSNEESTLLNALKQDDDLKLWIEAQRAGLFGRSGLNDILNQYINPRQVTSSRFSGLKKAWDKVDDVASAAYQGEDNIMRFSMLKSLTEQGKTLDEAMKIINNTIPDYTKPMSRLASFGRNSMLTPFISWTYYSTPIILKQFKERPERILAIYGALYGMNKLMGIDPFNEKDIPQQNFSMKRIPIYRDGNEVTTIKVDRWIPHNDMLNPLDLAKNLTSGGAWAAIPDLLRNRNSYFGGKITHNEGALKAYDLTKYGVQQITPDIIDNAWNLAETKLLSEKKRTRNPVIQPRTTTEELLKNVGINIMTYNKANQAKKVANEKMK